MTISSSNTFNVADQDALSLSVTAIVQPAAGVGSGRGRLIHPTLGTYDYVHTPNETVGIDADIRIAPIWSHTQTLGGGIDAVWSGFQRDVQIVERWIVGDTGGAIEHLRALWSFFANVPADPVGDPVIWVPNYATALSFEVLITGVRSGGEGYKLDRRLLQYGYAPSPVELELRVLGNAA